MAKKYQMVLVIIAVVLSATVYFTISSQSISSDPLAKKVPTIPEEMRESNADEEELATGRYINYDESVLSNIKYNSTILFFHASWCVECRAFDAKLNDEQLPVGVQVLKVDYDARQDLRQKYDVTIQTTFVRVNASGDKLTKWVGYGKDKSVSAIIENTR